MKTLGWIAVIGLAAFATKKYWMPKKKEVAVVVVAEPVELKAEPEVQEVYLQTDLLGGSDLPNNNF